MKNILKTCMICTIVGFALTVNGQLKLKEKLKKAASSIDQRTDQGIEKGLDKTQEGIGNMLKKKDKSQQQDQQEEQQNQEEQNKEQDQGVDQSAEQTPVQPAAPSLEAYSKFDFIPGEKVIFYEDFMQDNVGDFPALWNTNGSAEVVTTNLFPGKWMKFDSREAVWTDELLDLPENYTIEFDIIPTSGAESNGGMAGYSMRLIQTQKPKSFDNGMGGFWLNVHYFGRPDYSTWFHLNNECGELNLSGIREGEDVKQKLNNKYHIAMWVQKSRLRLYLNEIKVFDLPKAFPTGCLKPNRLQFDYGAAMVSNIRIAIGAPDTRSKLITEGKLVTYGIYFDVNKDLVKPESYGTLKDIAAVLSENPGVRVKIVGHTDSDGDDASNLDLSKRRGASVKNELVKGFGIDAARIETDGMGESQPVAANDTPVNKALNRRVELIKL